MPRSRQETDNSKPESRLLNRRNSLLCGTAFTAADLLCALGTTSLAQQTTGTPGSPSATTTIDGKYLPPQPPKFGGGFFQKGDWGGFSGPVVVDTGGGAVVKLYTNPKEDVPAGLRHIPMSVPLAGALPD
ncbi:hypothetical protein [Bradyrhizobium elkanii]|uniref:hypothetical protein n=1 Tax=Bradyrhizobium elkanii TaxID=29448 RepID=UPI001BAC8A24|nr:hypothetical protein [Bradyrhizobium elkanii]MBR1163420.1 hypothetical protein [Bradyrhizobium elkanii]